MENPLVNWRYGPNCLGLQFLWHNMIIVGLSRSRVALDAFTVMKICRMKYETRTYLYSCNTSTVTI